MKVFPGLLLLNQLDLINMKRKLELTQIGFTIRGTVKVNFWGGGSGYLGMDSTDIPYEKFTKTTMLATVNDGGFGVESIVEANVEIYALYDDSYRVYLRSIKVTAPIHVKQFNNWRLLKVFSIA